MAFSREQLLEIVTPHVLRQLVRLHGTKGERVTAEELVQIGLTEQQIRALVQTKRLIPQAESTTYHIHLSV